MSFGRFLSSVTSITYYDVHIWWWERVNAVYSKSGITMPGDLDKVNVRCTVSNSSECKVVSVTGNCPDVNLILTNTVNGRRITAISGVTAQLNSIAVFDGLGVSLKVN